MTEKQFWELKDKIINNCPRGEEYFCDGTPNLSVEGVDKNKKLGMCQFRINGKCVCIEKVIDNESAGMAGKRI